MDMNDAITQKTNIVTTRHWMAVVNRDLKALKQKFGPGWSFLHADIQKALLMEGVLGVIRSWDAGAERVTAKQILDNVDLLTHAAYAVLAPAEYNVIFLKD